MFKIPRGACVASGVSPFPSAYKEALDKGVIQLYYKGILRRDTGAIPKITGAAASNKALSAGE